MAQPGQPLVRFPDLYALRPRAIWRAFARDNFAFWMASGYLFFEYVRPQAIWPVVDAFPYWGRTLILLAFLGWLLDPKRQFVWTWITTGVFAYLGLVLLSSQFALWPQVSREHYMNIFNWVVIFFVLTQVTTTRARFYILLLIFFLASFKLSLYGARTWAMMGFRFSDWGLRGPQGFFANPGELAIQMVVFAPMALFFVFGVAPYLKRWQVYALYLMPLTAAMTTIATNTRGGQLALAVQVLALILLMKQRVKALVLVAVVGTIGLLLLPEQQKDRFREAGDDETSEQRLLYWKHGWQMMKDYPVLGVGYFNFAPYYTRYHPQDILRRDGAQLPHNIFIQVGTDTGFTGLGVFLFLLAAGVLTMWRIGREATTRGDPFLGQLTIGMNIALLGFVVGGQFVTITYYPYLWIHLAFVTIMSTFWKREQRISLSRNPMGAKGSHPLTGARGAPESPGMVRGRPIGQPRFGMR
jgi:putative inorganic carbon (hco3(-)) transporter